MNDSFSCCILPLASYSILHSRMSFYFPLAAAAIFLIKDCVLFICMMPRVFTEVCVGACTRRTLAGL